MPAAIRTGWSVWITMPEMDGAETARRLRETGQGREPGIILITSTDERGRSGRMGAAGATRAW
jgi:CheY-like chemotaxis protein